MAVSHTVLVHGRVLSWEDDGGILGPLKQPFVDSQMQSTYAYRQSKLEIRTHHDEHDTYK